MGFDAVKACALTALAISASAQAQVYLPPVFGRIADG